MLNAKHNRNVGAEFMRTRGDWKATSSRNCALAAFTLVLLLFADVVFKGASLAPLDYDRALLTDHEASPVSLYPELEGRKLTDSWADIGANSWQFQPAVRVMTDFIRTGESPWWNPYDATGRMGPESMVDLQFSIVTITAALFGGTSTALSFVLLALYFGTSFTLIRALNRFLELSFLASCTAAAVYLLGGFSLGNLNGAILQPYFLAPLVFLAILSLAERPSASALALAALGQAVLFAATFFPTMVLASVAVHSIALVFSMGRAGSAGERIRLAAWQLSVPVLAFCLMAFLYLPIFEANLNYVDVVSGYNARSTPGYSLESALSLFTPKHFWQSYRAFRVEPGWPALKMEPWVFHIGVIASLLGASGFARYRSRRTTAVALVSALLVAITVGQMFGIPPFTLIDRLPFFSFVRNEYWPALAGLPIAVLVALGLDCLGTWGDIPFGAVSATIVLSFLYLLIKLRMPFLQPERLYVFLFLAIFLYGLTGVLLLLFRTQRSRQIRWALALGVFFEGVYYMNTLHAARSHRDEQLPASIQWVKRQIPSSNGDRVLNIGGSGIMPDWGGAIKVPELGAIEVSIVPEYSRFYNKQIGNGLFLSFYSPDSKFLFTRESLSAVGVRFVIVERGFAVAIERLERMGLKVVQQDQVRLIFENPVPAPRAFLAVNVVSSELTPWELPPSGGDVTTLDARLIAAASAAGIATKFQSTADLGTVAFESYHNTSMRIRASNHVPAMLVVMDSWHPNWKARVDGVNVHVGCVDTAFRGVVLPAGNHIIEFTYRPKTLTAGLWISISSLVGTITLLFLARIRVGLSNALSGL